MKKILPLLLLLTGPMAFAQPATRPAIPATGRTLANFIPIGYDTLRSGYATGDLNRDGRPDMALVLGAAVENTALYPDDDLPARILLILLSTPTGYVLAARSTKAVLCKGCGGPYGNPFEGISIEKGVLLIYHYGGSSWRWNITTKFRHQSDSFYLIGESRVLYHNNSDCPQGSWEFHDTNFVTGEYRVEKDSEACKPLVRTRGKRQPKPLRKLIDYAVEP